MNALFNLNHLNNYRSAFIIRVAVVGGYFIFFARECIINMFRDHGICTSSNV